jgi:hypothetical protein
MSTVQEEARERAAQELAKRVAAIAAITDPLAWARSFMRDMAAAGNWRYVPPAPGIKPTVANPEAYERGAADARARLNIRKDQPDA